MENCATIKCEFHAGIELDRAFESAIDLSNSLNGCFVEFMCNGIKCSVCSTSKVNESVSKFKNALKNDENYVFCY